VRELRAYRLDNTAVLPSGLQARMSVIKVLITLDVAPVSRAVRPRSRGVPCAAGPRCSVSSRRAYWQRSGSLSVENDWEAAKTIA
jgi:hypothetical protein